MDQIPHRWISIAVGRVCDVCMTTQAKREFNDSTSCPGSKDQRALDEAARDLRAIQSAKRDGVS